MIDAEFRSEERFSRLALAYETQEEKSSVSDCLELSVSLSPLQWLVIWDPFYTPIELHPPHRTTPDSQDHGTALRNYVAVWKRALFQGDNKKV